MKRLMLSGLALITIALMGSAVNEAMPLASANETQPETTPLTQLVFRDKTVLISSSAEGIQYSLRLADGRVVADNLSNDQLAAQYPDLHNQVQTLIAGSNANDDVMIWGGLYSTFP
ncbi:MAG: hypothetical protein AAF921_09795 [Cyanobacteria bacterium P01_D01_bin.44]